MTKNDAVDWIVVELRDANDSTVVVASRAGILQRDGDIVDIDGSSMLKMYGVADGNYYVAVRFRNHLGIMTANPIAFSSLGTFDFTTANTVDIYGGANAFTEAADGSKLLYLGDANNNGIVNNTDLVTIAPDAAAGVIDTYSLLDVNLSGIINNTDLVLTAPNAATGLTEQIPD